MRREAEADSLRLFHGASEDDAGPLLASPAAWAVDLDCEAPASGLSRGSARLLLRISTEAACRLDAVGAVVDALCRRLPRVGAMESDLRLTLQEAVANAILHGNLALDGRLRRTREGLEAFTAAMGQRLADPHYAGRPVTIAADWNAAFLVLTVSDRGRGFVPPAVSVPVPPEAPCGRGILQIRGLCRRVSFGAGGRRIVMRFDLPPHGSRPEI